MTTAATPRGGEGKMGAVVLTLRMVGDPILRTPCDPVEHFGGALARLVKEMFAVMVAERGVGLAANQVGLGIRLFVYDCPDDHGVAHRGHVVNPVLVESDGEPVRAPEGCLSVPGPHEETARAPRVLVAGLDVAGHPLEVAGSGWFARCLQHEIDHLDGRLYLDRLDGEPRRNALRRLAAGVRP